MADDRAAVAQIEEELRRRDGIDSTREAAPLRIPQDAVVINTDGNTFEQTVEQVVAAIREREQGELVAEHEGRAAVACGSPA